MARPPNKAVPEAPAYPTLALTNVALNVTDGRAQMFFFDLSYALWSVGLISASIGLPVAHAVISKAIKLASIAQWKFMITQTNILASVLERRERYSVTIACSQPALSGVCDFSPTPLGSLLILAKVRL